MDAVAVVGGQGFGATRQRAGELFGVAAVVGEAQAALVQIALGAAGVAQQTAGAAEAAAVEATEDGPDEAAKAG